MDCSGCKHADSASKAEQCDHFELSAQLDNCERHSQHGVRAVAGKKKEESSDSAYLWLEQQHPAQDSQIRKL